MKIDGKKIAQEILDNLKKRIEKLKKKNITPCLAIILVGSDPASVAYVRQKELKAQSIGIKTATYNLELRIKNQELRKLVEKLNNDKMVHGIIVQQPLPKQINVEAITQATDPKKDVDGFHPKTKFEMPLAMAVLKILEEVYVHTLKVQSQFTEWLKNKKIVVMGKGETGGKPIIQLFEKMKVPLTIIDSKTEKPESLIKKSDIVISAVGKPNVVTGKMLKQNAILIGIGISRDKNAKLVGDYVESGIEKIASFYTPTPGGVGPVNAAMLLKNLVTASENFSR